MFHKKRGFKKEIFKKRRKYFITFFLLFSLGLILNAFYASALDTYFSKHSPVKDSTITISNPKISAYVISPNELNNTTATMKINGEAVSPSPSFTYKGSWYTDYYTGERLYNITSRKEGTISYDATNLKDGLYTVDVSITDKANVTMSDTWKFTVAEPPKFNSITPADKSEQLTVDKISAIVSDNTAVNWDTVKLKLNNVYVDPAKLIVDRNTGLITYNNSFTSNSYTAVLEAYDTAGIKGTKTWAFTADSMPPDLVSSFKDGTMITDGVLNFAGELNDLVDIKDNATLTLDGTKLASTFKYKGKIDYYGDYIITTRKQAYINYEGIVSNGNHTLSLYTEDKLGNSITRNWKFNVESKPVISNESPLKYGVDNLKPTISAVVKSTNDSINTNMIELTVDGVKVNPSYEVNTGLLTYTPDKALQNESYHSVVLTVYDSSGLTTNRQWKFYTNTYPDMKDSNASNCTICHTATTFTGSNGILEDVHRQNLSFGGTHSRNKCQNCHNYTTVPAGCSQCHSDPDGSSFVYAPHGSTANIKYSPRNYDTSFPIRVTENREQYDCIVCHQPGSLVKGYEGYLATPTRLLNNHDIPELHKTPDESCTKCHAQSLTREHARDGRKDASGNPITCNTCHSSTDPEVVKAIQDKVTDCSACHGQATHDSLHVNSDLSENCTGCHSNTLTTEHLKRENVTCSTCHDSQDSVVVNAVASGNKNCQTCHTASIHESIHAECKNCHNEAYKDQLKYLDNVITIH